MMKGQGDVTVTGFMECYKKACPAFEESLAFDVKTGETIVTGETCRRLANGN